MTRNSVKIDDWALCIDNSDPFRAPELRCFYLYGVIYGHPRFEDGERVSTSAIQSVNKKDGTVTTYSGNVYILGEPSAQYESEYPNAKQRLLDTEDVHG
jgi:hypothetical protein